MMIKNDQEYQNSCYWLQKFEKSVTELAHNEKLKSDPLRWQLYRDSQQSQADELKREILEYERLIKCDRTAPMKIKITDLNHLPDALIKARIAAQMSQAELANLLGIDEQRIQECEKTDYQCATWVEILEVSTVLGLELETAVMTIDFTEIQFCQDMIEKKRLEKSQMIYDNS